MIIKDPIGHYSFSLQGYISYSYSNINKAFIMDTYYFGQYQRNEKPCTSLVDYFVDNPDDFLL